jgi:hypothetical protein
MGTARATLNFVSSMPGPCLAWMTGARLRIDTHRAHRRPSPASSAARGCSQVPSEFNSLCDPEGVDEVTS